MQKTSQKRNILNKLREMTDLPGAASEKYFDPEFKQILDQLRDADDKARSEATGEAIGIHGAPEDPISLKDLLKSAKSNLNRREYMKAISDLGRFHKKMFDLTQALSTFKVNIDKVHERFLFQDMDDDTSKQLSSLRGRWKSATYQNSYFIKEANILDFFTNIATERGRALAGWEKRYPNKIKKLKTETISLLSLSERLLARVLSTFKDMAKARAARNVDLYINNVEKLISLFKSYDAGQGGFKQYYESNVKDFLEKREAEENTKLELARLEKEKSLAEEEKLKQEQNKGLQQALDIEKQKSDPYAVPPIQEQPKQKIKLTNPIGPPPLPEQPKPNTYDYTNAGYTQKLDLTSGKMVWINDKGEKIAHNKFINSLESLAGESVILIKSHIKRYAKSIWQNDPESSVKLFKIANAIMS